MAPPQRPSAEMDAAQRSVLLARVAAMVPQPQPQPQETDCVRVAIDGVDGSGKTTFADELAKVLQGSNRPVVRVSADGFHHPAATRHRRGRDSPLGFWLDSYDIEALVGSVLRPCGPEGSRRYRPAVHDVASDQMLALPLRSAPPGAVVVVDGLFLHRDELAACWELSVWLDVPFEVSVARMAARDGTSPEVGSPSLRRYVEGQRLYFAACRPWERADVVIDNTGNTDEAR